jgi:death-on-curing protein
VSLKLGMNFLFLAARNHALAGGDKRLALAGGDKRLALAAVIAFCGPNGRRLTLADAEAYDLVISVAAGQLGDLDAVAAILRNATQPRR